MALIEGFGDEVVFCLVLFAILTLLMLAWMSTGVRDHPLISVIIVDSQNFQQILQRISNLTFRPIQITRLGGADPSTGDPPRSDSSPRDHSGNNPDSPESLGDDSPDHSENSARPQLNNSSCQDPLRNNSSSPEPLRVDSSSPDPLESSSSSLEPPDVPCEDSADGGTSVDEVKSQNSRADTESTSPETSNAADESTSPNSNSTSEANDDEKIDEDGQLRIRLKYLDDRQKLVHANPGETVGDFKRKHFGRELAENLMVRFIYNGQELRQDSNTLQAYNVSDNSVIHCLLSSRPSQETPNRRQHSLIPEDWDAGYLMLPLFAVILGITWYFRIVYRTYFNAISTFSLTGITFLFFIALLASIRTQDDEEMLE